MTGGPIARPRASDTPPTWQLNRLAVLSWKQYGDEHVVFNAGSGDLHLLEGIAALVLRLIAETPLTSAELAHRVGSAVSLPADRIAALVDAVLRQLDELGLIEPTS